MISKHWGGRGSSQRVLCEFKTSLRYIGRLFLKQASKQTSTNGSVITTSALIWLNKELNYFRNNLMEEGLIGACCFRGWGPSQRGGHESITSWGQRNKRSPWFWIWFVFLIDCESRISNTTNKARIVCGDAIFSRRDLKQPCRKQQICFFKTRMLVTLWLGTPIVSLNQSNVPYETTLQFHLQKKILQDKENKPAHGILTFKPHKKKCKPHLVFKPCWKFHPLRNTLRKLREHLYSHCQDTQAELSGSSCGLWYPLSFWYCSYSVTLFPQLVSFYLQVFKQIFMYVYVRVVFCLLVCLCTFMQYP